MPRAGLRPRLVDRKLEAADRNLLVAGDDPLRVRLDRLRQDLVDRHRVSRQRTPRLQQPAAADSDSLLLDHEGLLASLGISALDRSGR